MNCVAGLWTTCQWLGATIQWTAKRTAVQDFLLVASQIAKARTPAVFWWVVLTLLFDIILILRQAFRVLVRQRVQIFLAPTLHQLFFFYWTVFVQIVLLTLGSKVVSIQSSHATYANLERISVSRWWQPEALINVFVLANSAVLQYCIRRRFPTRVDIALKR